MSQGPAALGEAVALPPVRRSLRDLLAIDESLAVQAFAQTAAGKLVLLVLFATVLMLLKGASWWQAAAVVGMAGACAHLPRYRVQIIFVAMLLTLFGKQGFWFVTASIGEVMRQERVESLPERALVQGSLVVFFIVAWGLLELARRRQTLLLARRPVVTLLLLHLLLVGAACAPWVSGLPRVALWAFMIVFTTYLWFLAYALADQRSRSRSPHLLQLGVFHPFWGSTSTPFGKGAAFLRKLEASNPADLAITQIKGLKLITWSLVLLQAKSVLVWWVDSRLAIPTPQLALAAFLEQRPYPVALGWASLAWATALGALTLAIWGHQIIAIARLAGFRLPRNTWRPLASRTLVDFWNRYYYYFKELLVQFFFLPTFLRMFRKHPRLRVFFATFMAAGVGNAVYHFIRDIGVVATMGPWGAVESYTSYLFYCVVLATGIGISQARVNAGIRPPDGVLGRAWSFVCVWGFVVCLNIFGNESRVHTLSERLSFMGSLFGVN
jgi:hypothetical protein